jgi:glycosyltransferase involved in cell wall biosynthesis
MNIIYTHNIFTAQKYGGVSRYFFEIIKRVILAEVDVQVIAGFYINEYVRYLPRVKGFCVPSINHTGAIRQKISEAYQRYMLRRSGDDAIVHQTYYSKSCIKFCGKSVVTVYDMVHELFPQSFPENDDTSRDKRLCCERADQIIAISHSTKNDLVRLFSIDPEKINVIHLGSSMKEITASRSNSFFSEPYLLFVGTRSGYKNFEGLLRAFAASKHLKDNFHVVCFGGAAFSVNEKESFKELGIEGLVHQVSGDDDMLATFYRHAKVFVYPSLYEGFGIPVLEAMSLGCPVVCSKTSSMPEVAGDAAAYFDPYDIASIQQTLEDTLLNESLIHDLRIKGRIRESLFSWERCAQETIDLYHSLLN